MLRVQVVALCLAAFTARQRATPTTSAPGLENALSRCRSITPNLVVLGDANSKHISWYSSSDSSVSQLSDPAGESLHLLMTSFGLQQAVHFPTYLHRGKLQSCLDLVFSTFPEQALEITSRPPLGNSDHLVIQGTLPVALCSHNNTPITINERWSWTDDRLDLLRQSIVQHPVLRRIETSGNSTPIDEVWGEWKTTVLQLAERFCKLAAPSGGHRPVARKPWITRSVIQQIKVKHALHRRYLATRRQADWDAARKQSNVVSNLLRESKSAYVTTMLASDQTSSVPNAPHLLDRLE